MIESLLQAVILRLHAAAGDARGHRRVVENRREIEAARLPVIDGGLHVEHVDAADHLVDGAESELRHVLANLLGDEEKEIDDVLGLSLELLAQHRILRGDAHRASVEMALAHHDAAHRDQRSRGETEFFGAQQRGDHNIAAGLQFAVGLHADAAAQIVQQENLLRFGQTKFPRNAGVLDGTQRGCAGAAGVAADQDYVGVRLGHARGHRADSDFRHQLHRDAGVRIHILQVVDQLREIFDRIDVVMRRRRDQSDAGDGVPQARDHFVDFVAGKLAALAGLRALRHLDLQLVGVDQIVRGNSETRRGNLLYGAAPQIAVRIGLEALFVFSAFAGVGLAADAVHGDGQSFVGFFADRPERHGAGGEALHDFFGGLDFFDRNRLVALLQLHQAAQRAQVRALVVDEVGVFLKCLEAVLPHGLLQLADGQRIEQVIFAVDALVIAAADREFGLEFGQRTERILVLQLRFGRENCEADAFQARSRAGEIGVDQFFVQADGFEDLRSLITLQSRDAHLREGLQQALLDRLHEVLHGKFGSDAIAQFAAPGQVFNALQRQIRIDRARPIAAEQGEVHHFARLAGFGDQRNLSSRFFPHQQVVHGGQRQQAWDGRVIFVHAAIGKNQQRVSGFHRQRSSLAQLIESALESGFAVASRGTARAAWSPADRDSKRGAAFPVRDW